MEEGAIHPAPVYTDLKTFPFADFLGRVDILSGGFPCQPFSNAGLGRGVEDPRHLFPFILEGIKQCLPRFVFLENVEGILSKYTAEGEPVLQYVLRSLEEAGYRTTWGIFSASEVGAPHQRKRVFIMGDAEHNGFSAVKELRGNETASDERRKEESQAAWESAGTSRSFDVPGVQGGSVGSKSERLASGDPRGIRWPSRPEEPQYPWEEPRVAGEAQPELGRAVDGPPGGVDSVTGRVDAVTNRVDRLRLLGNGVVPATSERAFMVLWNRLISQD